MFESGSFRILYLRLEADIHDSLAMASAQNGRFHSLLLDHFAIYSTDNKELYHDTIAIMMEPIFKNPFFLKFDRYFVVLSGTPYFSSCD